MLTEVQELLDQRDAGRLRLLRRVVDRLVEAGLIRDGPSAEHAVNVLWVVTSFDAYDLLTRGRGLPHAEVADALASLAEGQASLGA